MNKFLYLLLIFSFALVSCSDNTHLKELESDAVILAFGDSLTAGVGAKLEDSYPAELSNLISKKVINGGVSGETTEQGRDRFKAVLEKNNPDLIILLEGGNDILRNLPLSETKNNLAAMIEIAKTKNIPILLIGVPEKKLFSNSAPFYEELAEQYNLAFDGEIIANLIKKREYKSDSVHFNASGYSKLAERIREILYDQGAL